jgi:hypothetical protein
MLFNPYLAQRLAQERTKEVMRNAERARLIRTARAPKKVREWRLAYLRYLSRNNLAFLWRS